MNIILPHSQVGDWPQDRLIPYAQTFVNGPLLPVSPVLYRLAVIGKSLWLCLCAVLAINAPVLGQSSTALVLGMGQIQLQKKLGVREFVSRQYVHGMPYEEAKAYGAQALPELVTLLNDQQFEEYRPNIISLMGRIGDSKAINPLMGYLLAQKGEVKYPTFISILATFQALGFIAQTSDKALQILSSWSDPAYVQKSGFSASYRNYKDLEMAVLLSRMAIQGLGVSGRTEALSLLQYGPIAKQGRFKDRLDSDVKSAITLNRRIQTQGVAKTFGKEQEK